MQSTFSESETTIVINGWCGQQGRTLPAKKTEKMTVQLRGYVWYFKNNPAMCFSSNKQWISKGLLRCIATEKTARMTTIKHIGINESPLTLSAWYWIRNMIRSRSLPVSCRGAKWVKKNMTSHPTGKYFAIWVEDVEPAFLCFYFCLLLILKLSKTYVLFLSSQLIKVCNIIAQYCAVNDLRSEVERIWCMVFKEIKVAIAILRFHQSDNSFLHP